jgi:hypothetical protein
LTPASVGTTEISIVASGHFGGGVVLAAPDRFGQRIETLPLTTGRPRISAAGDAAR